MSGNDQSNNGIDKRRTVLERYGYRILEDLGSGSFAVVKLAYSDKHKCNVAIKIIHKVKALKDYLATFLPRQLEIISCLKHANIITFLLSIESSSEIYIITEAATGGSILEEIEREKRIPEKKAAFLFGQLVSGMDYCHSKGVAHRTLNCADLLLDRKGNLKIAGFSHAKDDLIPVHGKYPHSSTYCGTYEYCSPEMHMDIPYIPQLTDIWSMGVILHYMTFGYLPFRNHGGHKRFLKSALAGPRFCMDCPGSKELKDLVSAILKVEDHRMRMKQIKTHEWLTNHGVYLQSDLYDVD